MTKTEWGKILYLYAVKIVQATTVKDIERATRAGEAIAKLAKVAGYDAKTLTSDSSDSEVKSELPDSRASTEKIARTGTELREDQIEIIRDDD